MLRWIARSGLLLLFAGSLAADPQHFGFGQSYLAGLADGELVVWAPPGRAKDAPWLARWRSPGLASPQSRAWIAAGDFRPAPTGKALLALVETTGSSCLVTVFDPPESFSSRPWQPLPAKNRALTLDGNPLFFAAGDLLGTRADKLVALVRSGDAWFVAWVTPALGETEEVAAAGKEPLPLVADAEAVKGFACGDFWGAGEDAIAVAVEVEGRTQLRFFRWGKEVSPGACFVKVVFDEATDVPLLAAGGLTAGDFVKDGWDALLLVPADETLPVEVRAAPGREATKPRELGPNYDGRSFARQPLPGGASSVVTMRARPEGLARAGALAAGQLFGYVREELTADVRKTRVLEERPDAEIAFIHRAPTPSIGAGAPNFGWPLPGETVTWQIAIKNNGTKPIPAGAELRVWLCSPARNADTLPGAKPDKVIRLPDAIPPFDPEKPKYVIENVTGPWPFTLTDCPGARWKRLDLAAGEKWLVASLAAPGDACQRNDRLEVPWHGLTFHPLFRNAKTLVDRRPTVAGDPPSKEYLARKLADAVTCVWERAGTAANDDALVRVFFDGYELGWTSEMNEPARTEKLKSLQDRYEGVRELDGWWGEGQAWEGLPWKEEAKGELHATAHLYHPLGDLDTAIVHPTSTGVAAQGDGRPVQLATTCWGPDICATGHLTVGGPAAEYVKRFLAGTRGVKVPAWWEMAPEKVWVRVLDRHGNPVPSATVTIFPYGKGTALKSGLTLPDGKFDTGHPATSLAADLFGRKHFGGGILSEIAAVVTVSIAGHHEAAILGMEDTAAFGRLSLFHRSMLDDREWVWDMKTNWSPVAAPPNFTIQAAVEGSSVELSIAGPPASVYRIYRRWQPSYVRTLVGTHASTGTSLLLPLDLAERDAHASDRTRAIYEVTRLTLTGETLPRTVSVFAVRNALSLTPWSPGKLLVAMNPGLANPWAALLDGVTPEREFLFHPRPGHVATRIVRSAVKPSRLFATLAASDTTPDTRFEILDCPQGGVFAANNDIGGTTAKRVSTKAFRVKKAQQLGELNVGDVVKNGTKSARVVQIAAEDVTVASPIFDPDVDTVTVTFSRQAGTFGSNMKARELKDPRALALLKVGDREYIAIADTGNNRIVVWDDTTRYVTSYGGAPFRPCALAVDPRDSRVFFVLDRRPDRKSTCLRLTFTGQVLERDHAWNIDLGDRDHVEAGLAIAPAKNDRVRLAITDATNARITIYTVAPDRLVPEATLTALAGTHAGSDSLRAPQDCLFVQGEAGIRLFAIDARERVVEVDYAHPK